MHTESNLGPLGPEELRKDRIAGGRRWMVGAAVALIFLGSPAVHILQSGRPGWWIAIGLLGLALYGAAYVVGAALVMNRDMRARWGMLTVHFLLSLPLFPFLGAETTFLWIYVAMAGGMILLARAALVLGVSLALGMLVICRIATGETQWELAATLVALTGFMVGFAGNVRLSIELKRTREELAVAAVAAERERIGRDLHDILGHSLTAIAVKAGLARRLAPRDAEAAVAEIADVERLAREALADVRATASGYRDVTLVSELAVAGTVLRAAGITPVIPQAVDDVDPVAREVFGYVVREAVTNVVRHSAADHCTITLGRRTVEITDDGRGSDPSSGGTPGNGLRGLCERVHAVGGVLDAGPRTDSAGFRVVATVPATSWSAPVLPVAVVSADRAR